MQTADRVEARYVWINSGGRLVGRSRAALAGSGIRWRDVREGEQVMEAEVLAWLRARRAQPPRS